MPQYAGFRRHRLGRDLFMMSAFVHSEKHAVASFNALEPLALLTLEAVRRGTPDAVPPYNGGGDYMHTRINRAAAQTR